MNKIHSLENIQLIIEQIKGEKSGFLTNFYLDINKHTIWINKNELYSIHYNKCTFLVKDCQTFFYLYYFTDSDENLRIALNQFLPTFKRPLVIDLISKGNCILKNIFESCGFKIYQTLYRMSRIGLPILKDALSKNIHIADNSDAISIKRILDNNFDPIAEQIPTIEEINSYINNNLIITYKQEQNIRGFIIYELNGLTLYLRYWYVCSNYRNLHIGSKLFNEFMKKGKSSKRQLFWVIADNENAIKRYIHYGFSAENMFDYVLLKK